MGVRDRHGRRFRFLLAARFRLRASAGRVDRGTRKVGLVDTDGAVFPEAVRRAIEESDAFLFVIAPPSVESRYCEQQIEHARMLGKRILPVLRTKVADDALHEEVRDRNWIPFEADDRFGGSVDRLLTALDTDLAHVQAHTRWLVKALDWDAHQRDKSFLLRGSELASAESWLAGVGDRTEPTP